MNFDYAKHTVFLTVMGSRAYGLEREDSDWDYRGIIIPPIQNYINCTNKFEQLTDKGAPEVYKFYPKGLLKDGSDMQVTEITKFARLAAEGNPSIIEILFSDESNYVLKDPIIQKLIDNRDLFLSKLIKGRFSGYARSQLHRLKQHKHWFDLPLIEKPSRSQFKLADYDLISKDQLGAAITLIDSEVSKLISFYDYEEMSDTFRIELQNSVPRMLKNVWVGMHKDEPFPIETNEDINKALFVSTAKKLGYSDNFLEILISEKSYRSALTEWQHHNDWVKNRNPKRAALEKKIGYDTKFGVNLVRLLRMAKEIITVKQVLVKRHDAEELKEILNGKWKYDYLVDYAENLDLELSSLLKESTLPNKPDINKIEKIVFDIVMEYNAK